MNNSKIFFTSPFNQLTPFPLLPALKMVLPSNIWRIWGVLGYGLTRVWNHYKICKRDTGSFPIFSRKICKGILKVQICKNVFCYMKCVKGIQIQKALQFSILLRIYVKGIDKVWPIPKKLNSIFKEDTESLTIYTFSKNNSKGTFALGVAISNIFRYICKGAQKALSFSIFLESMQRIGSIFSFSLESVQWIQKALLFSIFHVLHAICNLSCYVLVYRSTEKTWHNILFVTQ